MVRAKSAALTWRVGRPCREYRGDCGCRDGLDPRDHRAAAMPRRRDRFCRVGSPPAASITGCVGPPAPQPECRRVVAVSTEEGHHECGPPQVDAFSQRKKNDELRRLPVRQLRLLQRRRRRSGCSFNTSGRVMISTLPSSAPGIGGGVLADDLAERLGGNKRILVLEAGSFVYPTHVYNLCRFSNSSCGESFRLRHVLAGRATIRAAAFHRRQTDAQLWRPLHFLVRVDPDDSGLGAGVLSAARPAGPARAACSIQAGEAMNESRSMGATAAQAIVSKLRQSPLAHGFLDSGNPARPASALLMPDGTPKDLLLHRAHRRVQHRGAADQSGGPHAWREARRRPWDAA